MIGYNKSTVVFISQLKGAVHPLVLTNQGISKPPLFSSLITLITYLLSFTLAWSCPWLAVAYPSHHLTALVCWLINIRDSVFFLSFCSLHQSLFVYDTSVIQSLILRFPPPRSCLSLFSFYSFLYLQLPFNPSWLPSASCLHLPVVCLCGFLAVAVQVSWTEGVLCPVCYSSWG